MKKVEKENLKVINAKFNKNDKNENVPRMRNNLPPDCKRWWKILIGVLDKNTLLPCDGIALSLLYSSLASYERVKKTIDEEGETYKSTNEEGSVITCMRPEVEILKIYSENVVSGLREFLLTPDSRSYVEE